MRKIFAFVSQILPTSPEDYKEGVCYVPEEELTQEIVDKGLIVKELFESSIENKFLYLITSIIAELSVNGILAYNSQRDYVFSSLTRIEEKVYINASENEEPIWQELLRPATEEQLGIIDENLLYKQEDIFNEIPQATYVDLGYIYKNNVVNINQHRQINFRKIVKNTEPFSFNDGILSIYYDNILSNSLKLLPNNIIKIEGNFREILFNDINIIRDFCEEDSPSICELYQYYDNFFV